MNRIFFWTFSWVLLALLADGTFATEAAAQLFSYDPVPFGELPNTLSPRAVSTSGFCENDPSSSTLWLGETMDADKADQVWLRLVHTGALARLEDSIPLWELGDRVASLRCLCNPSRRLTLLGFYITADPELDYKGVLIADWAVQTNPPCGG